MFFLLISVLVSAQEPVPDDTLYLKNGRVIHGIVLNPGAEGSIQVKTNDGARLFLNPLTVDRIVVFERELGNYTSDLMQNTGTFQERYFVLRAGGAFPFGAFSSSTGLDASFAKTGVAFGFESWISILPKLYWTTSASYAMFDVREPDLLNALQNDFFGVDNVESVRSWRSLFITTGGSYKHELKNDLAFIGQAQIGFSRTVSNEFIITTSDGTRLLAPRAASLSFGSSLSAGIQYKNRLDVQLRMLYTRAPYIVSNNLPNNTRKYPIGSIHLSLGYYIKRKSDR